MRISREAFDPVKISDGSFVGFGHRVINLTAIRAVVIGRVDHVDGSVGLVLREESSDGTLRPGQWEADPARCRSAVTGLVAQIAVAGV